MIRKRIPFALYEKKEHSITFRSHQGNIFGMIAVLEEDMFRVLVFEDQLELPRTWSVAPGLDRMEPEGRDRFDLSGFSLPEYCLTELEDAVVIEAGRMKVVASLDGFRLCWYLKCDGQWQLLYQDRKTQAYNLNHMFGPGSYHYIQSEGQELIFGAGEKTGNILKNKQRYLLKAMDCMGYDAEFSDPLYKHIPFYITRNERSLYIGLRYDSYADGYFDFGKEIDNYHKPYRYYFSESEDLDYYVMASQKLDQVVKRNSWLSGQTAFPPKWSLGYSGSAMRYTDAPDATGQLQQFVVSCEKYDILCQSFQLSSGYTSIGEKRYAFHWNQDKFPDPKGFSRLFLEKGLRLCANIKPALLIDHPDFRELKEQHFFIENAEGEPELVQFWDDLAAYIDFTNPKAYEWWQAQVKQHLLALGITSTWNDNNEYEIWDKTTRCHGFGIPKPVNKLKPIQTLLMLQASCEAQKSYNPHERPYLISRSGCLGMQRYVQTWTGDNYTEWKTLRFNAKMGIGLSLSGIYNFGHDVGGFAGPAPERELFIRWLQHGIFMPRLTIHSWNSDNTVNEPWMYQEDTTAVSRLIKLRYRFIPYLYHCLYLAHIAYEPIIRPLFYDFRHTAGSGENFFETDEYLVGDSLYISNCFDKGMTEKSIFLPEHATGWFDYYTHAVHEGGHKVVAVYPLDERVPIFVRGNRLLPVNIKQLSFATKEDEEIAFEVFAAPGIQQFEATFMDDDGISDAYKEGSYEELTFKISSDQEHILVSIFRKGLLEKLQKITFLVHEAECRDFIVEKSPLPVEIKRRGEIIEL
jgi:alpha-glucosidase